MNGINLHFRKENEIQPVKEKILIDYLGCYAVLDIMTEGENE